MFVCALAHDAVSPGQSEKIAFHAAGTRSSARGESAECRFSRGARDN
jgi:hypothetical protein